LLSRSKKEEEKEKEKTKRKKKDKGAWHQPSSRPTRTPRARAASILTGNSESFMQVDTTCNPLRMFWALEKGTSAKLQIVQQALK